MPSLDLPTRLDLFARGRAYVLQRATKIDPIQVDTEGSDVNIYVGVASVIGDHIVKQLGYRTSTLFLDGCETDDDLARYAFDRYKLLSKGASPARTTAVLKRVTGGLAGDLPIGTRILTKNNTEYQLSQVASFSASSTEVRADCRASQAGKATQVGRDQFVRLAKPGDVFDPSITVTNPQAAAGGEDAETLDVFRERVRDYWRTARRGILAAVEYGATTVPGVVSAQAVEALTPTALPARVINLYIADSSGVASDALARLVQTALLEYRGGGVAVLIYTSLPLIVDIELALRFTAGVDTITLSDNVRAAVVEFVNSLPVNGVLYRADLFSVLRRYVTDGLVPDSGSIVAPVGDLVPAVGQTIRTTTANVVLV